MAGESKPLIAEIRMCVEKGLALSLEVRVVAAQ